MPSFEITSGSTDSVSQEYDGIWWISTNPSEVRVGKLSLDSKSFGTLYLQLGLMLPVDIFEANVIHGISGNRKFTLLGAMRPGYSAIPHESSPNATDEYWLSQLILEGAHLTSLETSKIKSFRFETEHLVDWLNKPSVTNNFDLTNPILSTQIPGNINFTVTDLGAFIIGWKVISSHKGLDATIRINPEIVFTPSEIMDLPKFFKSVMQPFLNFISFCLDYSDTPKNIRLDYEEGDQSVSMDVFAGGLSVQPRKRQIFPSEQILPFRLIEANIELFLVNWYSLTVSQEYAIEEFFSVFEHGENSKVEDFPRLVGALESWHSHWRPDLTQVNAEEYASAKAILLEHATGEVAELLRKN